MIPLDREVESLFHLAMTWPKDERWRRLSAEGSWSDATRSAVLALLRAESSLGGDERTRTADVGTGERIGPYEVVDTLGSGAGGTVYLGRRTSPPERLAAVKVVRDADRELVMRFRLEAAALARLDHPGIAAIHEFGELPDGRVWFAMTYVAGDPIVAFAEGNALPVEARVALVADACDAIAHAHRRGILHRDLKPSNILVEPRDEGPRTVIIDLGLAKALDGVSLGAGDRTRIGQIVGTPEYMAPEQALGQAPDARMDVYGLGCVLAATLAGSPPRSRVALAATGLPLFAAIAKVPPRLPGQSERLRDDPSLSPARRRDLDAIVLKAIAIDPADRYGGVAELESDLRRWLRGDIPAASRAHPVRRTLTWIRRNRAVAALAAALVLGATGGTAAVVGSARQATLERRDAETLLSLAEAMLLAGDPWYLRGHRSPVLAQAVAQADALLETERMSTAPRGELLRALSRFAAGDSAGTVVAADRAIAANVGEDPAIEAQALLLRAYARESTRDRPEEAHADAFAALALARRHLPSRERRRLEIELGAGRVITRQDCLGAADILRDALDRSRASYGEDDPLSVRLEQAWARALGMTGDPDLCHAPNEAAFARAIRVVGPMHPCSLAAASSVMATRGFVNDWQGVVDLYRQIEESLEEGLGPSSQIRLTALNNVGFALITLGRYGEAQDILRDCADRFARTQDPIHPLTILAEDNLVWALELDGRLDEAEGRLERLVTLPEDQRVVGRVARQSKWLEAIRRKRNEAESAPAE